MKKSILLLVLVVLLGGFSTACTKEMRAAMTSVEYESYESDSLAYRIYSNGDELTVVKYIAAMSKTARPDLNGPSINLTGRGMILIEGRVTAGTGAESIDDAVIKLREIIKQEFDRVMSAPPVEK